MRRIEKFAILFRNFISIYTQYKNSYCSEEDSFLHPFSFSCIVLKTRGFSSINPLFKRRCHFVRTFRSVKCISMLTNIIAVMSLYFLTNCQLDALLRWHQTKSKSPCCSPPKYWFCGYGLSTAKPHVTTGSHPWLRELRSISACIGPWRM